MKGRKATTLSLLDHAGYRAAFEKINELRSDLSRCESEISQAETILRAVDFGEQHRQRNPLATEAAALLTGGEAIVNAGAARETLKQLRHKRDVLGHAVRLQEEIVQREVTAASRQVCQAVAPEYRECVAELGRAIIALGQAALRELEVRGAVERSGANWQLPRLAFQLAGNPRDTESASATWLRQAVLCGYLDKKEIPAEWLAVWGCYIDAELREQRERAALNPPRPSTPREDGQAIAYTM